MLLRTERENIAARLVTPTVNVPAIKTPTVVQYRAVQKKTHTIVIYLTFRFPSSSLIYQLHSFLPVSPLYGDNCSIRDRI